MAGKQFIGALILAGLLSGGLSGCEVVRAGVFIATVPQYHGGEGRESRAEQTPEPAPFRVPPTVRPDAEDE